LRHDYRVHEDDEIDDAPGKQQRREQRRCSKRQKREPQQQLSSRMEVERRHVALNCRTDDAHATLAAMTFSSCEPSSSSSQPPSAGKKCAVLSLKRLRACLDRHVPLDIDRRSPESGRTFVQMCCAADFVNEAVVRRCVEELTSPRRGADPNVYTRGEYPFADRPAVYFAISRLWPSVVECLASNGASMSVRVRGRFRLVSEPSQTFEGNFTPLKFALRLLDLETGDNDTGICRQATALATPVKLTTNNKTSSSSPNSSSPQHLSPYWIGKLRQCIAVLKRYEASEEGRKKCHGDAQNDSMRFVH